MSFTFSQARKLSPEEANPMNAMLSTALARYKQGLELSYMPRKNEADIFSKEIGPLASLAASPNFTGFQPEEQKMIAQRIRSYLGGQGGQGEQGNQESEGQTTPGYATDEDIHQRLTQGSKTALGKGGQANIAKSEVAGLAQQWGLPDWITKHLGSNEAASENAKFTTAQTEGMKRLKMKGYTDQEARDIVKQKPGENDQQYNKRTLPFFISKKTNVQPTITSLDQKVQQDEQAKADAEETAAAFNTTPDMVLRAQSEGITTKRAFEEFLKRNK